MQKSGVDMGKFKAVSVLDANAYVEEKYGAAALEKVKAALTAEDVQILFSRNLMPISWIDVNLVLRHLIAQDRVLGRGDFTFAEELMRHIALKQINGIYKMLLLFSKPENLIEKTPQIWNRYYDTGKVVVESVKPGGAVLKLTEFPGLPLNHEYLSVPFIKELLTRAGAKNCTCEHSKCLARGDQYCEFNLAWG
jgi:hypothetical protein